MSAGDMQIWLQPMHRGLRPVVVTEADAGIATLHAGEALACFDGAKPLVLAATDGCRLLRFDTPAVDAHTGRLACVA